jgi:hypothetical protein
VDGGYALFPGAQPRSSSAQAHVLTGACAGAGVGLTLYAPQTVWFGGEVEKRTAMFELAHAGAAAGEDWLWVIDGDELVTVAPGVRQALESTQSDVAEVLLWSDDGTARCHTPARRLFRTHSAGVTVRGNHFTYVDGEGRALWGGADPLVADQLWDVRQEHRLGKRPAARIKRQLAYYERRDSLGVEDAAVT